MIRRSAVSVAFILIACGDGDRAKTGAREPTPPTVCEASTCASPEGGGHDVSDVSDASDARSPSDGGTGDGAAPTDAGACCDPFVARLANIEEDWPRLRNGYETRSFSSYDRNGGNSDGFVRTHSALYDLPSGEHVVFDAYGPGVLDTLWFTGEDEGGANLDLGTVRFYLDDEEAPRLEVPWMDLFRGDRAPFLSPLVQDNAVSTGAYVSWVPVPYAARLVVTTTERPSFYQAHYETLPPDTTVQSFDPSTDVGVARARFERVIAGEIASGLEDAPLDAIFDGPGTLDAIRFVPAAALTDDGLGAARLQITWDEEATPAVDVPLGAFFASGLGVAEVRSLPLSMHDGALESRFVMPYWKRAHVVISGIDGTLSVRRTPARFERGQAGYFHATYVEARPTVAGQHFEWLNLEGAGTLAGTVLTVEPSAPLVKKWWEGDLHSTANHVRTPAIEGTGHEDDHLGGWSNTFLSRPFTLPLHGEPRADILDRTGQYNANATMYRFYPGIRFASALRHAVEHGDRDAVVADYSGVAFYYLDPDGARLVETDALDTADPDARAAHAYTAAGEGDTRAVTSRFDGPWSPDDVTVQVTSHTGAAVFRLAARSDNHGCHLRRVFDQSTGRQGARVSVSGAAVGVFYAAETNAARKLAERDFFLPESVTRGKVSLDVSIEPLGDSAPWTAAGYRLLCLVR